MAITDGIITLEDAKASIGVTGTQNDSDLEQYISAATPVIENIAGPVVVREVTYTVNGGEAHYLLPARFTSVVSVEVDGVATTGYDAYPRAGIVSPSSGVFTLGAQNVEIVVSVGYETVPANIVLATRELVRFWWQQGRQGNRPGFGNEAPSDPDVSTGYAVPRRVIELLQPDYRMPGFA